jgi:hypothetical protein
MRKLIRNAMITPDGTLLQSRHRHDFVQYTDANGLVYMVDGGLDYIRRSINDSAPHVDKCVYDDVPHEEQREVATWGTYGKNGDEPLSYVTVANMSTEHIKAVVKTQDNVLEQLLTVLKAELWYRDVIRVRKMNDE